MLRSTVRVSALVVALAAALSLAACSQQTAEPQSQANEPAATSPFQTEAPAPREDIHAFAIGALSATALRDGALEFPNDNQVFGVGHTPDEVASVLDAAGLATDTLALGLQPLLVKADDRVLLFDTGAGAAFGDAAGHLGESLAAAGVAPAEVTDIFISHAHGDHVGGLVGADGALAFANARIHMSEPEWKFLSGMDAETSKAVMIPGHAAFVAALEPKVVTFAPDAEILPVQVKAVAIKGHTPGHSGYLISSGQDSLLYVGDAAHHSVISVQKPEWPNGFDGDAGTAATSRSALVEQLASNGQRAYNVHGPFPGVGRIQKQDGRSIWVAE